MEHFCFSKIIELMKSSSSFFLQQEKGFLECIFDIGYDSDEANHVLAELSDS